jgi:hypothetical protein
LLPYSRGFSIAVKINFAAVVWQEILASVVAMGDGERAVGRKGISLGNVIKP